MPSFATDAEFTIDLLTRDAAEQFLSDLVDLDAAVRSEQGALYSEESWTSENLLRDLPEKWSLSHFVTHSGQLVGFIIASRKGDFAHVHRLAVREGRRKRGIGGRLLGAFVESARRSGIRTATLSVSSGNDMAVDFYRRCGFSVTGRSERNGLQHLAMSRPL